jgi:hypothetical protein
MKKLLLFVMCLLSVPVFTYAGGQVPGQPFQYLQQQIDELKEQVSGYWVEDGGWMTAGYDKGVTISSTAYCPNGMKPVGFGGEALFWESEYDSGDINKAMPGVWLMTGSKPAKWTCTTPEDGGSPYTEYGWQVSWYNNYQGPVENNSSTGYTRSAHHAYVICVGKMIIRPCRID